VAAAAPPQAMKKDKTQESNLRRSPLKSEDAIPTATTKP
jgi:hypothetical protein